MKPLVSDVPVTDIDIYGPEMVTAPHQQWEKIRAEGNIVYASKNQAFYVTSHPLVQRIISDWRAFTSSKGIGIRDLDDYDPPRIPSLLLETDPPEHDKFRKIMMKVLSAENIARLRTSFEEAACRLVDDAVKAKRFDGLADLVQPFTLNVIADAVGVPKQGRKHLLHYGAMIVEASGPNNYRFHNARDRARQAGSIEWVATMMKRGSLTDIGFAAEIFAFVDSGDISETEAELLVRIFLNASVDSTVGSIVNGVKLLAERPQSYEQLRSDPSLIRTTFEETARYHGVVKHLVRTASVDVEIEGQKIRAGQKIALGLGAANRDPAKFDNPDVFDITRRSAGHVGFGVGTHACAGQMMARLEADVLYRTLLQKVKGISIKGNVVPLDSNAFTTWARLPLEVEV